jgi:hypothetical protein
MQLGAIPAKLLKCVDIFRSLSKTLGVIMCLVQKNFLSLLPLFSLLSPLCQECLCGSMNLPQRHEAHPD